ncbi:hypothetical protein TrRE_jg5275 [Triparma retinervis]|uniref:Fe2OG dioxygenase domain-containing protein n=1 Tax=Triparma retinervis TaxID=2557542 RepID=A0A9W6ZRU0_9STRA|nr:hypothetical protein TrRE_jg5275 [Triparma retinervis]
MQSCNHAKVAIDKLDTKEWTSMNSKDVRMDKVSLIRDDDGVDKGIRKILSILRGVASQLDAASLLDGTRAYTMTHSHKVPLDCQVAVFSPDSNIGYRPHRDNATLGHELEKVGLIEYWRARPYRRRAVTAIVYLNDLKWGDDEGGELELFVGADEDDDVGTTAEEVIRIRPEGGTMVVFDSRKILHTRTRPPTALEKQAEDHNHLQERMKGGKWNNTWGMYWEDRLDTLTLVFELVIQQGLLSHNEAIHPLSSICKHVRWTLHPIVTSVVCRRWDILEDQLLTTFPPRILLKKKVTMEGRNRYDDNPYLPNIVKLSLAKPGFHVNVDREFWRYKDIVRVQLRFPKLKSIEGICRVYCHDPFLTEHIRDDFKKDEILPNLIPERCKNVVKEIAVCTQRRGEKCNNHWTWELYEKKVVEQFPNVITLDLSHFYLERHFTEEQMAEEFPITKCIDFCKEHLKNLVVLGLEPDDVEVITAKCRGLKTLKAKATNTLFLPEPGEFDGYSHGLETLDMSGSNNLLLGSINTFLPELERFRDLVSLDLSNNNLRGEIDFIVGMTKLESLDMSKNYLGEKYGIPEFIGDLESLRTLNLSGNRMKGKVPKSLKQLTNLTHLILHSNQLGGEPPSFKYQTKLIVVDISLNYLEGKLMVGSCKELKKLDVSHNEFKAIQGIQRCTKLKFADFSNNNIDLKHFRVADLERLQGLMVVDVRVNRGMIKLWEDNKVPESGVNVQFNTPVRKIKLGE